MRLNLVTTSSGNLSATQSARMLPCSRLLRLAESLWHQRLKTHGINCTHNLHKSRQSLFLHPLLQRLAQFVLSFKLQLHHNQRHNLNLHKRHSQSTLAMEVQIPEDNDIATTENVAHVAMLLFAGYIDAATSMSESCGGGGSTPSSGWGKKDDEDDWKFAHRCAQMAHSMCKPKPRYRFRR